MSVLWCCLTLLPGGLTPLQIVERSKNIIGWSLFDRDPVDTFEFGRCTLVGDAAHPMLPHGSQGIVTVLVSHATANALFEQPANVASVGFSTCLTQWLGLLRNGILLSNRTLLNNGGICLLSNRCLSNTLCIVCYQLNEQTAEGSGWAEPLSAITLLQAEGYGSAELNMHCTFIPGLWDGELLEHSTEDLIGSVLCRRDTGHP